jgi:hypothetical protein
MGMGYDNECVEKSQQRERVWRNKYDNIGGNV